jgi:hypothetical protein
MISIALAQPKSTSIKPATITILSSHAITAALGALSRGRWRL